MLLTQTWTFCICNYRTLKYKCVLQIWFSMDSDKIHSVLRWSWVSWLPSLRWWTEPEQLCFSFHLLRLHLRNWQSEYWKFRFLSFWLAFYQFLDGIIDNVIYALLAFPSGLPIPEEASSAGKIISPLTKDSAWLAYLSLCIQMRVRITVDVVSNHSFTSYWCIRFLIIYLHRLNYLMLESYELQIEEESKKSKKQVGGEKFD